MDIALDILEEDYKLIEQKAKEAGVDLNSYVLSIFEDVYSRMIEATKNGREFELKKDLLEHRIVAALAESFSKLPEATRNELFDATDEVTRKE